MKPPSLEIDIFSDEHIADPYPLYAELRALGPVVWLPAGGFYAVSRYADVRALLHDWQTFSSARGSGFNKPVNLAQAGTTLASDPPLHDQLRKIIAPPLFPKTLRESAPLIEAEATALVDRLVARGHFDVVSDLAWHLPTTIVTRLVGLPEEGRENMRNWGINGFDAIAPLDNPRVAPAMARLGEMISYVFRPDLSDHVLTGSWAAKIFDALAEGKVDERQARSLLLDYVAPSLDTTVSAMASMMWLLANHPDAWKAIRADPTLIPRAILEAIRIETPIRLIGRETTCETEIDGMTIPAGARIAPIFASANRDERKYPDPDRFDIYRNPTDHVGFGYGTHICVGMHLAQLEIRSVVTALASRVERLEIGEVSWKASNQLRCIERLDMTVHAPQKRPEISPAYLSDTR